MVDKLQLQEEIRIFREILENRYNPSQIATFLTELKIENVTCEEIAAFANLMKEKMVKISSKVKNLVDTAGTGGDGNHTFNISTASAIVAAGAGVNIAKHGNRSASSKCGSSDVLEALGVKIDLEPKAVEKQIEEIGIGFLFARIYHPAMKNVAEARRELGFKTIFNVLGPLTNPANAKRQVIGVYDASLLEKLSKSVREIGTEKTLIVSSDTDEISISADTNISEISNYKINLYSISPEDFGFKRSSLDKICANDRKESANIILEVLNCKEGPAREIVLLNAGAAIYVSGIAGSIRYGVTLAEKSIDSGKSLEKLEMLRRY
ncbi:MAG: anthranilate phosphoribosyltransferase [Candidatus Micrarchaeota archaeon]